LTSAESRAAGGVGLPARCAVFVVWAVVGFALYMCFISIVDGPELVAGALIAGAVGALGVAAAEPTGRGLLRGGRRWYAPAAVWPLDVVSDCALLAKLVATRAAGRPVPAGELRTLRLHEAMPPALAGFWLSSTPGACVVGVEGRTLIVHALSSKPSRVERILTAPGPAGADTDTDTGSDTGPDADPGRER
jgi:hypothetical protein